MIDFLKNFFSKNLLLKAFSLVFAFLLWLVVVNQLDPVTNQTIYNVPITIENEDYFTERNQYVTVDSELSVNVTVSGRRSVVEKLTADNFTATVDYMEVEPSAGRGQVRCVSTNRSVTIQDLSQSYIQLTVEDMVSKEIAVEVQTEGTPAGGYLVIENDPYTVAEPSTVTIQGPESQVSMIQSAIVTMDVEGATEEVSGQGKAIEFLNADGAIVNLDDYPNLQISAKLMTELTLPVYTVRTISINPVEIIEDPNSDYTVKGQRMSVDSVEIYGPADVLAKMGTLTLNSVMTQGQTGDFQYTYDLSSVCASLSKQYQANIGLAEGSPREVVLTVELVQKVTRQFTLSISNYSFVNQVEGKTYQLTEGYQTLTVKGSAEALENMTAANIRGELDVSQYTEEGTYDVAVIYTVPEGVTAVDPPETLPVKVISGTDQ